SSRGIESIEIVGLEGSIRTSSISLECGRTAPPGLDFGGGRWSLPTSSSVSGSPWTVGASTFGATLTGLLCLSASTILLTSPSVSAAAAAPESSTIPSPPSRKRLAIHHGRRGGSAASASSGTPSGGSCRGGGGVVTVLIAGERPAYPPRRTQPQPV